MFKSTLLSFLLITVGLSAQNTFSKRVKSESYYIEVRTDGIDNLVIEESENDQLEMVIKDKNGLGVIHNLSCSENKCTIRIKTELKIEYPMTDKINMFHQQPPSNVTAVVKIPKNREVTVFGKEIDIQTQGYKGVLFMFIDKGNIRIAELKGVTEIELASGNVYATIKKNYLDIKTRKGTIHLNDSIQKSPLKRKIKKSNKLSVESINANVLLTE